jgi:hypothetical protein
MGGGTVVIVCETILVSVTTLFAQAFAFCCAMQKKKMCLPTSVGVAITKDF